MAAATDSSSARGRATSRAAPWRSEPTGAQGNTSRRRARRTGSTARRAPTPSSTGCARLARRAGLPSARTARPRPTCTRCSRWRPTGWRRGSGATWGRARRRRRARSDRLLAAPAAGPRHLPRVRTPPHPPGAVHRRAAGRRRAAHAARPAHRRTAGASAALRAVRRLLPVPGRRGTVGRPRVSAHGRRACRKAGAERGPR